MDLNCEKWMVSLKRTIVCERAHLKSHFDAFYDSLIVNYLPVSFKLPTFAPSLGGGTCFFRNAGVLKKN
jgi:hypothetical protein